MTAPTYALTTGDRAELRRTLSSNARPHWAVRARAVRDVHEIVGWEARAQLARPWPIPTPVEFRLTFVQPDRRRRDAGSLAGLGKAILDGLVAADVLPDDNLAHVAGEHFAIQVDPGGEARWVVQLIPTAAGGDA